MVRTQTQAFLTALAERGRLVSAVEANAIGAELGLDAGSVRLALHRLNRDDFLKRVRRGFYVVTPPGVSPPPALVIGSALTENAAISGWAALHHHGLTEQLPRVTEVMTTSRVRRLPVVDGRQLLTFEGERFEVFAVTAARMFGVEDVWFDNERARILDRERALLEVFIRPGTFGGLETALEMLEEHNEIARDRLVKHALKLGVASVCKRVGWSLENTGAPVELLKPLLKVRATSYSLLDPSRPARGVRRSRWHLRENLS